MAEGVKQKSVAVIKLPEKDSSSQKTGDSRADVKLKLGSQSTVARSKTTLKSSGSSVKKIFSGDDGRKRRSKTLTDDGLRSSSLQLGEEEDDEVATEGDCRLNHILVLHQEALCCQFSTDGRLIAFGLLNGAIRVYDSLVVSCLYVLASKDVLKRGLPVTAAKFEPSLKVGALKNHLLAACYSSGFLKFWHVEAKECLGTIEENRQTLNLAFSRDGCFLATAGDEGRIFCYDVKTRQRLIVLEASESLHATTGHKSRVFALAYHPLDFHNLLSGGWDSVVHIWDDRRKHSIRTIAGPHLCGDGIDVVGEENLVMTASWHKKHPLQLWDFTTTELVKEVIPDTFACLHYCGQFMKRNYIITGGSNNNMVRVIDRLSYSTIASIRNLPNAVFSITHNPFFVHPKVACISGDKVFVLDVKLRTLKSADDD